MNKTTLFRALAIIWISVFFNSNIKAQEVYAPDGYSLSVTFPDNYSVINKANEETKSIYLPNLYEASYSSPDNQLQLSATFGTFQRQAKPSNKKERMIHLEGLVGEIKNQTDTEFYMYEPFVLGSSGSGLSFTCSKGKNETPVYNGTVFIIDDKLYMFFAKLSDLKHQNQVLSFFKSAVED
ncbi:MAG: hypothetical protein WD016_10680 [Balneolaceae bacterium]